jgi:hypothetical protein
MASSGHGGKSGKGGKPEGQYKTKVPAQCKNPIKGKCLQRKQKATKGR